MKTLMTKCDFNKVAKQLYWNCTSAWVFSRKFAAYFQNTFFEEHIWMATSETYFLHGTYWIFKENWASNTTNFDCNFIFEMIILDHCWYFHELLIVHSKLFLFQLLLKWLLINVQSCENSYMHSTPFEKYRSFTWFHGVSNLERNISAE